MTCAGALADAGLLGGSWLGAAALSTALAGAGLAVRRAWRGGLGARGGRSLDALLVLLVGLGAWRAAFIAMGVYDLSGDEAYYWEWSRRLDVCYVTKGPAIAWLIAAGTAVFGDTELGVRSGAVVLSFLTGLAMYRLGCRLYDVRTSAWAAGVMQVTPIFAFYSVGMTIDSPLIFLWVAGLLAFHRALERGGAVDWLALGLVVGLGVWTKYTIALLPVCAMGYLLATRRGRRRLWSPWPWAAAAVAASFFVPLLWWDSRHGWIHFGHNIGHTKVQEGFRLTPLRTLEFVGSQLGVITPILLVFLVWGTWRRRRGDGFSFAMSIPIVALFLLKSLQGKVQPNWALPAYVAMYFPFAAEFLTAFGRWNVHVKRLVRASVIVAAVATGVLHVMVWVPLSAIPGYPAKLDPMWRVHGWRRLAAEVDRVRASMGGDPVVFSTKHTVTALMSFYCEGQPRAHWPRLREDRVTQYDYWPGLEEHTGRDAVFVTYDLTWKPFVARYGRLRRGFDRLEPVAFDVPGHWGASEHRPVLIVRCYGLKGIDEVPVPGRGGQ